MACQCALLPLLNYFSNNTKGLLCIWELLCRTACLIDIIQYLAISLISFRSVFGKFGMRFGRKLAFGQVNETFRGMNASAQTFTHKQTSHTRTKPPKKMNLFGTWY